MICVSALLSPSVSRLSFWIFCIAWGGLLAEIPATAQQPTPQPVVAPVVDDANALSEGYRPVTDQQVAATRLRALEATRRLDQFLSRGSQPNMAAWHSYLKWDELHQQLQGEATDPAVLGEVLTKFYTGESGLELPVFVELRDALMTLRRSILAQADPEIGRRYVEQMTAIQSLLSQATALSDTQRVELTNRLEWLDQLGQSPQLVAQTRRQFNRPNLLVAASAKTISEGFSEPVSETTPLNEMILQTHVCGTAHTRGTVTAGLVPAADRAVIELVLVGTTHSNTVGYQSPVTIRSNSVTQVLARKRLIVDELAVVANPATASCTTDSRIRSISAGNRLASGLIEKIAWKQARQQLPRAERVSSQRAAQRIASRLDEQSLERIAQTNTRLRSEVRLPLQRRNIYPHDVRIWTTAERLHLNATQGRGLQLAAATVPPSVPAHDLQVQIHESLLGNTAVNAIGGMTVTDERAQELVKEATGEVPEELKIKQDEDPWSITFDLQQPLVVTFADQQIRIAIRGRRFVRGDQVNRQTTQIAATYLIKIEEGRARLIRQGEIDVTYPEKEGERLSLTELRNKTFIINKFEGLFKPELGGDEVKVPERWQKLKDLVLVHASADQGWLSLGWQ